MVSEHSRARVASVDRIIAALRATLRDPLNDAAGLAELAELDRDGLALLGELFLNFRASADFECPHCEPEGTGILDSLVDWCIHYSHSGSDRENRRRLAQWYAEYLEEELLRVKGGAV